MKKMAQIKKCCLRTLTASDQEVPEEENVTAANCLYNLEQVQCLWILKDIK